MKRTLICAIIGLLVLLTGCQHEVKKVAAPLPRVLVIHGLTTENNSIADESRMFRRLIRQKTPELDMHFLYLPYPHANHTQELKTLADSLDTIVQARNWKPDIVVIYHSTGLSAYLSYVDSCVNMRQVPIIFADVLYPEFFINRSQRKDLQITGFRDSLYLDKNLEFFRRIWGPGQDCTIELDSYIYTVPVKAELANVLQDTTRYVNNMDCHLALVPQSTLNSEKFRDKLVVNMISLAQPESNHPPFTEQDDDTMQIKEDSKLLVRLHYNSCHSRHQLIVWHDIFSHTLAEINGKPQLNCRNTNFGATNKISNLGGYFPDNESMARDILGYVKRILNGEKANDLPWKYHTATYHLNWLGMQQHGLSYEKFKDDVHIINVPDEVTQPGMTIFKRIMLIFLLVALVFVISYSVLILLLEQKSSILKRSQRRQTYLVGGAQGSMIILDKDTVTIQFVDPSKSSIVTTPEKLLAATHPDDQETVRQFLAMSMALGTHQIRVRCCYEGEYYWYELLFEITEEARKKRLLYVLVKNIDQQKKSEEKMLRDQESAEETRMKEAVLANMTHDIRSPLSTIAMFANMLTDNAMDLGPDECKMISEQMEENTDVLLNLLNDVVGNSRIQLGEYRYMRKDVDVSQLVNGVYTSHKVIMPQNLRFNLEEGDAATINVDPARLVQVLNNLMSNAIKATHEGAITLGWKLLNGRVNLYVQDTGVGIAQENLPTLFEKFTQFNGKKSGAGLGLNICKTIVEAQDGHITVQSQLGVGTVFTVDFPLVQTDVHNQEEEIV